MLDLLSSLMTMNVLALFLVGFIVGAAVVLTYVLALFAVAGRKHRGGGRSQELDHLERLRPVGNVDLLEEGGG